MNEDHDPSLELFDAVPDLVVILSRQGIVLEINQASARAYARPRDAIIGQALATLNPDLPSDFLDQVVAAADRGAPHRARSTQQRADGSRFPVEVHSTRLHYRGQDAIVIVARDISSLQRDETLFRRVQELALIGTWQWNRSTDALYLTLEAQHILGAHTPPTSMSALLACLSTDDSHRLRHMLTAISEGTGFDLELQGQQADGRPFWVSMIGEPDPNDIAGLHFSGTLQDITARKRAEAELRHQAHTDALTGLLNRDAILDHVSSELHSGMGQHLAVLYIDLDRFKIVNDLQGHEAGDELLMEAAQRIRNAVGQLGQIARFGGDEFLVTTRTDTAPDRPEHLARLIQSAFAVPFQLGKDEFNITTSIGISRGISDGHTSKQLIQNADVAMYESKRRRRNGFHTFSPALAQRQQQRLQTETRLRRAIDNKEFHLVYQPQVDLRSGRIVAAEALLRWHNPELGHVGPDRFIDLAESTGEIVRIGRWVLGEACHQLRRWKEQGLSIERVAVNVSYRQFIGENLALSVQHILDEAALPGHALELELTERVLVEDIADTSQVLNELRSLGVLLSIDDFGEGYSALNYLRRLPIHALKLSHSFLHGIPGNKSDEAICQTVVAIARSLGLGMVAEGIETEAQRDHMLRLGVTIGQGFLFAPGLLPGELGKRLAKQR